MDKQKLKQIFLILTIVILTIIFFSYNIVICVDSSHYCWLTSLIHKGGTMAQWDTARGMVFPLIIKFLTAVFGKNVVSLQIGMFIAYAFSLIVTYLVYKDMKKEMNLNVVAKILFGILSIFLIILNPLIMGYYHTILTEYVGMTACIVISYMAWQWIECDFKKNNRIKYCLFTIYFAVSTVFMWHLKQPYVLTVLAPVIIAAILSIIKKINWRNLLQRIITIALCIMFLFVSLKIWNSFIAKCKGEDVNNSQSERTSEVFLTSQLLGGLTEYHQIFDKTEYTKEAIEKNEKIEEEDKEKIIEILDGKSTEHKGFILLYCSAYADLENCDKIKVLYTKEETLSFNESVKNLLDTFKENPGKVIKGYFNNYLTVVGVYKAKLDGDGIYSTKQLSYTGTLENNFIAYNIYRDMLNDLGVPEHYYEYIDNYVGVNRQIKVVNNFMLNTSMDAIKTFKLFLVLAPIVLIICFIKYIVLNIKKAQNNKIRIYELLIILYGYAFLNVLMNAVLGALFDRYAISSYIAVNLAVLIHITYLSNLAINSIVKLIKEKVKKDDEKYDKNDKNNSQIKEKEDNKKNVKETNNQKNIKNEI